MANNDPKASTVGDGLQDGLQDGAATTLHQQQDQRQQVQGPSSLKPYRYSSDDTIAILNDILKSLASQDSYVAFSEEMTTRIKAATAGIENRDLIEAVEMLVRTAKLDRNDLVHYQNNVRELEGVLDARCVDWSQVDAQKGWEVHLRLKWAFCEFKSEVMPPEAPSPADVAGDKRYHALFDPISRVYNRLLLDEKLFPHLVGGTIWKHLLERVFHVPESALWAGSIGVAHDRVRRHMKRECPLSQVPPSSNHSLANMPSTY